jgi:hypothetical protein
MLLFLLHRADARRAERREPVDRVQPLEDLQPIRHGLVRHLQVFA